jgi:hypothetical protein
VVVYGVCAVWWGSGAYGVGGVWDDERFYRECVCVSDDGMCVAGCVGPDVGEVGCDRVPGGGRAMRVLV